MKKGIEVCSDYDNTGRWCLRIKKARGKFTLDEIIDAAREYEEDFYAIIIKAMSDDVAQFYEDVDLPGDYVTLYSAEKFLEGK